jgi:riboflavin kinase / FMN adenylyltransferase
VVLEFVERLRPTLRFDGVDALVTQMADDVARSRDLLGVPQPFPASGPSPRPQATSVAESG